MCELLGLSSNGVATVNFSLAKLAEHGSLPGTLHDGWGVAYFEGRDARVIKDSAPVSESDWIPFIANHNLRSTMVIAHTRSATRGIRSYSNAQPYSRELAGRAHLFAHNGDLPGIFTSRAFETSRFNPIGDTDSERVFCLLLDRMASIWTQPKVTPPLRERFRIVSRFASDMRAMGPANFLYSDGDVLFAHGHRRKHADTGRVEAPALFALQRKCKADQDGLGSSGLTISGDVQLVILFASVPLTNEQWEPLSEGEVVATSSGRVLVRQLPGESPKFYGRDGDRSALGPKDSAAGKVAITL